MYCVFLIILFFFFVLFVLLFLYVMSVDLIFARRSAFLYVASTSFCLFMVFMNMYDVVEFVLLVVYCVMFLRMFVVFLLGFMMVLCLGIVCMSVCSLCVDIGM